MYTVKVLSEAEFDKLPFKHVKTSLGCANPKTGIAYIRDTGYNDITKHTIAHELDELIAKTSPHEEDGIRYKNLADTFKGFGNTVKNTAGNVAQGVGNVAKGVGNAGKGIFDFFKGSPAQTAAPNTGMSSMTNSFLNKSSTGSPLNLMQAGMPTAASAMPKVAQANPSIFQKFGTNIGSTVKDLAGPAAISLMGNLFAPKIQTPDFSGISNDLRNSAVNGVQGSEFRELGGAELRRILQTPDGTPPDNAYTQGDLLVEDQLTDDIKNLNTQYKAIRPGADLENDTSYRRDIMKAQERARNTRAASRDALTYQHQQAQAQMKYNTMVQALQIDQTQLNQLISIAQLDVAAIMLKTGISQAEAMQMKQMFGDLGQVVAAKNMGLINKVGA